MARGREAPKWAQKGGPEGPPTTEGCAIQPKCCGSPKGHTQVSNTLRPVLSASVCQLTWNPVERWRVGGVCGRTPEKDGV